MHVKYWQFHSATDRLKTESSGRSLEITNKYVGHRVVAEGNCSTGDLEPDRECLLEVHDGQLAEDPLRDVLHRCKGPERIFLCLSHVRL